MLPLSIAPQGEKLKILKIGGGGELRQHLLEMGFVVGSFVSVVSGEGGGLIVNVKGSRVAISNAIASKIFV